MIAISAHNGKIRALKTAPKTWNAFFF